ncbi:MAG: glycosyl transferase family 1, partial [Ignavibacteriales bacterium CG_4_9_14_3_um_filter_34_10]
DELIDRIEFAYNNREKIKAVGQNAGKFMRDFTWSNTAEKLIKIITD